jgi:general secretion pathway protein I
MSMRRMSGFTLLEVIIAFAILGLSLSALYGVFASALARTRRDAQLNEGTLIAQSLLARAGLELSTAQDSYAGDWNGYSYLLTQEWVNPPAKQSGRTTPLLRATARIHWNSSSGARDLEISTLKIVPRMGQ